MGVAAGASHMPGHSFVSSADANHTSRYVQARAQSRALCDSALPAAWSPLPCYAQHGHTLHEPAPCDSDEFIHAAAAAAPLRAQIQACDCLSVPPSLVLAGAALQQRFRLAGGNGHGVRCCKRKDGGCVAQLQDKGEVGVQELGMLSCA
eukprot:364926-Chlamydomonas_euryale.AAC.4